MREKVNTGILVRIGANKGGYWEVKDVKRGMLLYVSKLPYRQMWRQ